MAKPRDQKSTIDLMQEIRQAAATLTRSVVMLRPRQQPDMVYTLLVNWPDAIEELARFDELIAEGAEPFAILGVTKDDEALVILNDEYDHSSYDNSGLPNSVKDFALAVVEGKSNKRLLVRTWAESVVKLLRPESAIKWLN